MEVTDMTEMFVEEKPDEPSGPIKFQDYSGVDPFTARAAAAENVILETTNNARPSGLPKGYLSYSQIDLFLRCKLAYWKRYFEKKEVESDKKAADFGRLVHKVLEEVYLWIQREKYRGKFPIDVAFDFLKKLWAHPEHGMAGARPEYWMDARDILRKYAQENAMIDHEDVLAVELGDMWTEGPDPKPIPNANIGGVPIVAKLDLVLKHDEKTVKIRDYKTDRMLRYKEDLDRDLQLGIYDLVVRAEYPWAEEVILELYMLRHGVSQTSDTRSLDRREDVAEFVAEVARQISTETEWAPTMHEFCHWCDYKGDCPKYSDALQGGATESAILARDLVQIGDDPKKFAEMFGLRDDYNNRRGVLDRRKKSFDKALSEFLDRVPGSELVVGDKEFYVFTQRRTEYENRLAVVELIASRLGAPEGFVDAAICKIQKTSVDKVLEALDKKKKTLGEVFKFDGPGSEKKIDSAFISMLRIELESVATISHSTRLVSRKAKISAKSRAKKESEGTAIPMVTDSAIMKAKENARTAYTMDAPSTPAPKKKAPEPETPIATHARTPVNSSNLRSIGYDPATQTLEIEFTDRGVYLFVDVPSDVHASLMAAPSKGGFFSENIRKVYKYEKTDRIGFDRPAEVAPPRVDPHWQAAAAKGVKAPEAVTFEGAPADYIDPGVSIAMWKKADGGTAAATRKGKAGAPPPAPMNVAPPTPEPSPSPSPLPHPPAVTPPQPAIAPPQSPDATSRRKRKPMTEETKAKLSAAAKERWAKKKAQQEQG